MTEIIDAHGHVWTSPDEFQWVVDSFPAGTTGLVYTIDNFREECAKTSAERALLVATPHHGPGSPYVRECVAQNNDLFGIVTIDHTRDDAVDRTTALLDEPGVVGMRFVGADLADVPAEVWHKFAERDVQAQLLTAAEHLPIVERLARNHPDVTFVLDHLGARDRPVANGDAYGRLEAIAASANTYVKVTSTPSDERFPHVDIFEHVRRLLEWFGPDRLMWGSDYVYRFRSVTPWQTRMWLAQVPTLSDRDRAKIEGETARQLLED